ncbi:MAG: peptidylprolyl isomerase [Bryobacteraceae bacterium]
MTIFLFLLCGMLAWGQQAASDDPVVLTVGAEKITKSQFEKLIEQAQQPGQAKPALTPDARRRYAENIAELKILAQEARKQKIDQDADVKFQVGLRTDQILAYTLFQQINANLKADDAARKKFYEDHKNEWESVTAKHILIRFKESPAPLRSGQKELTDTEALTKAKDIRAKVVAGGDFTALAKTESDDTGSGAQGGDLGDFTRGRMVPQFEEAAFAAKIGEVTEPVKTQFGYHLILVSKHDSKKFEDVAAEIDEKLKPELAQKAVDELKKSFALSFDQEYFGK